MVEFGRKRKQKWENRDVDLDGCIAQLNYIEKKHDHTFYLWDGFYSFYCLFDSWILAQGLTDGHL